MKQYPAVAVERAMKVQEVLMQAIGKKITWFEAAEILGDRSDDPTLEETFPGTRVHPGPALWTAEREEGGSTDSRESAGALSRPVL